MAVRMVLYLVSSKKTWQKLEHLPKVHSNVYRRFNEWVGVAHEQPQPSLI